MLCVHGYLIYKDIQEATVDVRTLCLKAREYLRSLRHGSGRKWDSVKGHLPRKVSCVCTLSDEKE